MINITNEDNMELMKRYPDNYFDLAIVDPPYRDKNQPTKQMREKINGDMKDFGGKPDAKYFKELFRVSKNQIIWGANNFIEYLYSTNCFVFWDKVQVMDNYSDGELAWTSFKKPCKQFRYVWSGNRYGFPDKIQGVGKPSNRVHPTEKPTQLYTFLLQNYSKEGDKILDTHIGSGSIAIAVDNANKIDKMNLTLVGCELDKDYYNATMKRIKEQTSWQSLF
jgi:site-specific DNA-methyltransferase (adenine-specific)